MFLSIFTFAGFVIWATHGKTKNGSSDDTVDKKDITAEAMIMTAILSDDEKSESSSNSNSSSSSSSSSNSDDFFLL